MVSVVTHRPKFSIHPIHILGYSINYYSIYARLRHSPRCVVDLPHPLLPCECGDGHPMQSKISTLLGDPQQPYVVHPTSMTHSLSLFLLKFFENGGWTSESPACHHSPFSSWDLYGLVIDWLNDCC